MGSGGKNGPAEKWFRSGLRHKNLLRGFRKPLDFCGMPAFVRRPAVELCRCFVRRTCTTVKWAMSAKEYPMALHADWSQPAWPAFFSRLRNRSADCGGGYFGVGKPADDYLRINPAGQLPCLVTDEGITIAELSAIAEYLDEIKPDPDRRNNTERAVTRMRMRQCDYLIFAPMVLGYRHGEGRKFSDPALPTTAFPGQSHCTRRACLARPFAGRTGLHMRQQTDLCGCYIFRHGWFFAQRGSRLTHH